MKNLTIFEGCDCTGKTTAAKAYAHATKALYFPLGPLKGFTDIAHVYLNAMEPAIAGRADVVMDRCWISEPIYGAAFRNGADRIGTSVAEALEAVAASLTLPAIVLCDPGWKSVETTFRSRPEVEMLNNLGQLGQVYDHYREYAQSYKDDFFSRIPLVKYNYQTQNFDDLCETLKIERLI